MAHHSITVRNVNSGGNNSSSQNKNPKVINFGKRTSATTQFREKNNLGNKVLRGIRIGRTLNVGSAVGMLGGGAGMAVAVGQEVIATMKAGTNFYADVMKAKSGETMLYHNFKQGINMMTNPLGYVKEYAMARFVYGPLETNRKNQELDYNRRLTGNLIHSKAYYNTMF